MKIRLFIALISVILLTYACSDDDNGSNTPSTDEIVGTWVMQNYEIKVAGQSSGLVDVSDTNLDVTFTEDGEFDGFLYNMQGTGYSGSGTYTLSDSKLIITDEDGEKTEFTVSINGGNLKITSKETITGYNYEIIMNFTK